MVCNCTSVGQFKQAHCLLSYFMRSVRKCDEIDWPPKPKFNTIICSQNWKGIWKAQMFYKYKTRMGIWELVYNLGSMNILLNKTHTSLQRYWLRENLQNNQFYLPADHNAYFQLWKVVEVKERIVYSNCHRWFLERWNWNKLMAQTGNAN